MIGTLLRIRYEISQEVSEDPIFATYMARDRVTGRDVKVRVVRDPYRTEEGFIESMRRLVDKLKTISHTGVEHVIEMAEDNGLWFVVSEGCGDPTLEERIKRLSSFSVPVALSTAINVCEGLEALHRAGLVHGDLSARNVLSASSGTVKLQLAGFWECYGHSGTAGAVMLGLMAPYLAPEVTSGGMPTETSDIYALGVLLFQMLAGHFPYSGDTPVAIAVKHATAPCPSLRTSNQSVPHVLDEIVRKALSKAPEQRYGSVAALLRDLRTLQDALRFGRSLTWPLTPAHSPQEPPAVAPRMSAVRPEPRPARARKAPRQPEQEGLPWWLVAIVVVTLVPALFLVGAWAYYNVSKPKLETVPNLVGLTVSEANARLQGLNLRLRVKSRKSTDEYPENTIISVLPEPGRQIREHTCIDAVVSDGSRFVEAPDLRGRTVDDCRSLLSQMNLQVEEPVEEVRDPDLAAGLVVSQVPEPHKKVERNSSIRLKVSAGNAAPPPTATGGSQNLYTLRVKMPKGAAAVLVRVEMTDDEGTRTVHEQEHEPGDNLTVREMGSGSEATFRIFFDGDLVKQVTQKAPRGSSR